LNTLSPLYNLQNCALQVIIELEILILKEIEKLKEKVNT